MTLVVLLALAAVGLHIAIQRYGKLPPCPCSHCGGDEHPRGRHGDL